MTYQGAAARRSAQVDEKRIGIPWRRRYQPGIEIYEVGMASCQTAVIADPVRIMTSRTGSAYSQMAAVAASGAGSLGHLFCKTYVAQDAGPVVTVVAKRIVFEVFDRVIGGFVAQPQQRQEVGTMRSPGSV